MAEVTPDLGFAMVACEGAQDALASAAKILSRFGAMKSEPCKKSVELLVELHNRLDLHRRELLKQATGGIVAATHLPPQIRE